MFHDAFKQGEWSAQKAFLDQQVCLLQQQSQEKTSWLEESITSLQTDKQTLQDRVVCYTSHCELYTFICKLRWDVAPNTPCEFMFTCFFLSAVE